MKIIIAKKRDIVINSDGHGKVIMDGVYPVDLNGGCVLFDNSTAMLIFPYEYHVTQKGTIIFFTVGADDLTSKEVAAIKTLANRAYSQGNQRPVPKDTASTRFLSAAA